MPGRDLGAMPSALYLPLETSFDTAARPQELTMAPRLQPRTVPLPAGASPGHRTAVPTTTRDEPAGRQRRPRSFREEEIRERRQPAAPCSKLFRRESRRLRSGSPTQPSAQSSCAISSLAPVRILRAQPAQSGLGDLLPRSQQRYPGSLECQGGQRPQQPTDRCKLQSPNPLVPPNPQDRFGPPALLDPQPCPYR